MKIIKLIIMVIWLQFTFLGYVFGGMDGIDDLTLMLMEKAAARDTAGLLRLQDRAMLSKTNRYAYHLARYIADPQGYAETYIAEFPSTPGDVMGLVYVLELAKNINGKQVTPYFLYSFDHLGKLAIDGSSEAADKLFNAMLYSDGVVTEFLCGSICKLVADKTSIALDSLSKLSTNQRMRVYLCFGSSASSNEISDIKRSLEKHFSESHLVVGQEILDALVNTY